MFHISFRISTFNSPISTDWIFLRKNKQLVNSFHFTIKTSLFFLAKSSPYLISMSLFIAHKILYLFRVVHSTFHDFAGGLISFVVIKLMDTVKLNRIRRLKYDKRRYANVKSGNKVKRSSFFVKITCQTSNFHVD